jgi:hypothetical protein
MWKESPLFLLLFCLFALPAKPASADPVLAASFLGTDAAVVIDSDFQNAFSQSFIVRHSGDLTEMDLLLFAASPGTVTVNIYRTLDGLPDGEPLGSVTVPSSAVPEHCCGPESEFVRFSGFRVPIAAGDTLSAVLTGVSQSQWLGAFGNQYPEGSIGLRSFPDAEWISGSTPGFPPHLVDFDFSFRAFVDAAPAPIPEPTSVLLLGTGGLALVARARKRSAS